MRRRKKQEKQKEEPVKPLETPPPTPPSAEPPNLPKSTHKPADGDESGGFGPPAALLRWQRPRAKSEYINPYPSLFDKQVEESKRLSSTLPWRSSDLENKESKEISKDDSALSRVTKDFESTVAVSKPPLTKSKTYHFEDESKLEDWDKKQEEKRQVSTNALITEQLFLFGYRTKGFPSKSSKNRNQFCVIKVYYVYFLPKPPQHPSYQADI